MPLSGTSANPAPFPGLNGKRVRKKDSNDIYFIIEGKKRFITNPIVYSRIFKSWDGVWTLDQEMFDSIETGEDIGGNSKLLKSHFQPTFYLYLEKQPGVNGNKHPITSMEVNHYCNFKLLPEAFHQDDVDLLTTGSTIDYKGKYYINNETIQIGVDVDYGGSITHLCDYKQRGNNLINNFDQTRQIQQSYYAGPWDYKPENYKGSVWPLAKDGHWKWNPTGACDYLHNHSCPIEIIQTSNSLYVKTRPLQWALDNISAQCIFESTITVLERGVARVCNKVSNFRSDTTDYAPIFQELPAVYLVGKFDQLYTYFGCNPFTKNDFPNDPARKREEEPVQIKYPVFDMIPGRFPWANFVGTEHWAAFVTRQEKWGVGIYNKDCTRFNGGYIGIPFHTEDANSLLSAHIAPLNCVALKHDQVYEWEYYLVLGYLDDIRDRIYDIHHSIS